ncbi:MAG: hypothetical protein U1E77_17775 [Inhella sp.]
MTDQVLLGQKILVGLTYLHANGQVREQKQLHGHICAVEANTLSFEQAHGAGIFSIPFGGELDSADPEAVYTLRNTGEVVTGVNFIASFTIHAKPSD